MGNVSTHTYHHTRSVKLSHLTVHITGSDEIQSALASFCRNVQFQGLM